MKCTNHPEIEADGMCVYCGKPFCKDCLIEVKGKFYCKDDIGNVIDDAKSSSSATPIINITNSNESINTNTNNNTNAMPGMMISPKNKTVALVLCIIGFFGLAGLHRFYVGKMIGGLLYLFTWGLFGIGTIIDLISILSGSFRDRYGFVLK